MLELINFILCILILIPALIILFSLKGKKPNKVKEDILFIEKQILKSLILTFYLLLYLYELFKEDEIEDKNTLNYAKYNIYKTKIICFNIYIILLFKNNIFNALKIILHIQIQIIILIPYFINLKIIYYMNLYQFALLVFYLYYISIKHL